MVRRKRVGEILMDAGKITPDQLDIAMDEAKESGAKLGEVLISRRYITFDDLGRAIAEQFDVRYEPLQDLQPSAEALAKVPANFATNNRVLPLIVTETTFTVAMANPDDLESLDWLQAQTGRNIEPLFALPERIGRAIAYYYGVGTTSVEDDTAAEIETADTHDLDDNMNVESARRAGQEAPIIRLVNHVIAEAAQLGASDIHFEPQRTSMDVRIRVDGSLRKVRSLPNSLRPALISRLKLMADIDITERRLPQDGRISIKTQNRRLDIRVNSLPTKWGERIVLRLLDVDGGLRDLSELGMLAHNEKRFREALNQPHGLLLVTGPTGSGKTTTLYAGIKEIRSDTTNILTAEDPVEYELPGICQTQVHEKIGLTFASQLRAALRQDPDVILVGEIRDLETAEVAARAAMTGHLVLSTLHTNDAPSAIPRLIDMEVEPYLINSSLLAVTAQRLVRKICDDCKEEGLLGPTAATALDLDSGLTVWRGKGCVNCSDSGNRGRIGVHEVLTMTEEIQSLCLRRASGVELMESAIHGGMVPLSEDVKAKMLLGMVSPEEAVRFIGAREEGDEQLAA